MTSIITVGMYMIVHVYMMYCVTLCRYGRLEKAFRYAVDLEAKDLCMVSMLNNAVVTCILV